MEELTEEYEKKTEEMELGYSPFFGLYFKDTAKEKEKARRKEEAIKRKEEKARRREEKKVMRYEEQRKEKKEKEEREGDLYKKLIFDEYKQLYEQEIRKAFSEGNEYLRRGEREKAAEKYKEGWGIYNSLKILDNEEALKSMLQEKEIRGRGGIEERIFEEEREQEAVAEPGETEEKKEKKPFFTKIKNYFSKKPLTVLYVDKAFFINKWFGCFLPGAKVARENWRVQGRPGWEVRRFLLFGEKRRFLGQSGDYQGKPIDTRFTHYVYEKDYTKAEGEEPKKEFLYHLAEKLLPKIEKAGKTEEQIANEELDLTCGKVFYTETWKTDVVEGGKDRIARIMEDVSEEHHISDMFLKERYHKGNKGVACLDTLVGGKAHFYKVTGFDRPWKNSLHNAGDLYLFTIGQKMGFAREYYLDEKVISSIIFGKGYTIYDKLQLWRKRKLAQIEKSRIKSFLCSFFPFLINHIPAIGEKLCPDWRKEHYKIYVFDKEFAESDEIKNVLAMIVPYIEKAKKYKKMRFRFEKGKPTPYHPIHLADSYIASFERVMGR